MKPSPVLSAAAACAMLAPFVGSPATATAGPGATAAIDRPHVAWAELQGDRDVIRSGSRSTPVPDYLSQFAPMGSGFVVSTVTHVSAGQVRWISADGKPGRASWQLSGNLATSPHGKVVAFATQDRHIWVIDSRGDRVRDLGTLPGAPRVAVAGVQGESCGAKGAPKTCTVFVNRLDKLQAAWTVGSDGLKADSPSARHTWGVGKFWLSRESIGLRQSQRRSADPLGWIEVDDPRRHLGGQLPRADPSRA